MGLILDSSVLIAAERDGQDAQAALRAISHKTGNVEIAISVVTVMELAHGVARANTAERRERRRQFVEDIVAAVPVHTVTPPLAWRAGTIDGESQARGCGSPSRTSSSAPRPLAWSSPSGRPTFGTLS